MEDYKKYFDMPLAFEPRSLKPSAPDVSKQSLDPVDC